MKLWFCLIPRVTAGRNARTMLPKKQWDIVRFKCYQDAGYTCEVCDGIGPQHPVECHEQWEWDVKTEVQCLVRLIALCPDCHQAVHIGHTVMRASLTGGILAYGKAYTNCIQHVSKVNGWTFDEANQNLDWHIMWHAMRNDILWAVNIDLVKDIEVQDSNIILEGFVL